MIHVAALFWLSLFPFATRWMKFSPLPTVPYGVALLMAAIGTTRSTKQ